MYIVLIESYNHYVDVDGKTETDRQKETKRKTEVRNRLGTSAFHPGTL